MKVGIFMSNTTINSIIMSIKIIFITTFFMTLKCCCGTCFTSSYIRIYIRKQTKVGSSYSFTILKWAPINIFISSISGHNYWSLKYLHLPLFRKMSIWRCLKILIKLWNALINTSNKTGNTPLINWWKCDCEVGLRVSFNGWSWWVL